MASPIEGPTSLALNVEALVQRLSNDREVEEPVDKRDDKERDAAQIHIDLEREEIGSSTRGAGPQFKVFDVNVKLEEAKTGIDSGLGDHLEQPLGPCYEEIKNIIFINNSPVFKTALEEWSKKETLFTNRVERKKKKVANLKNEIYQVIGFFSVFQGVLLTAVTQSNLLHCNNWWSPILLSLLTSVLFIFGVVQKLMQIIDFEKTVHSEEQSLKEVIGRLSSLRRLDIFKFATFENRPFHAKQPILLQFQVQMWIFIGLLVVISSLFPLSHWKILCNPGPNPYAVSSS